MSLSVKKKLGKAPSPNHLVYANQDFNHAMLEFNHFKAKNGELLDNMLVHFENPTAKRRKPDGATADDELKDTTEQANINALNLELPATLAVESDNDDVPTITRLGSFEVRIPRSIEVPAPSSQDSFEDKPDSLKVEVPDSLEEYDSLPGHSNF